MTVERDYVESCPVPVCDTRFVGMTPEEYRRTHAREDCPKAPLAALFYFPI